jgi:hypothetical protein
VSVEFEAPPLTLPKPPWWSQNERDALAMTAWVEERLKRRLAEKLNAMAAELDASLGDRVAFDDKTLTAQVTHYTLDEALAEAAAGEVEPLRALYPTIADYIHPPKRERGQRRWHRDRKLESAVDDVRFIRQLWKREYGHYKRAVDNPPFAIEIAANFWGVPREWVESRVDKNAGRDR